MDFLINVFNVVDDSLIKCMKYLLECLVIMQENNDKLIVGYVQLVNVIFWFSCV